MRESISEILAIARSGRFTAYTQGVPVRLPTGETVTVKIERTLKSLRPPGLRFSAFAFMTEVSAGDVLGVGFGEAPTNLVALQRSIAEGVERAIYKALKGTTHGSPNSNGWAAHINRTRAADSAVDELVERDAVLVHWLRKIPMRAVTPTSWPTWLSEWTRAELCLSPRFNQLRVLISSHGYKPTLTTVLTDKQGYAVLSHATAKTLDEAMSKALAETCRIAQIAIEGLHVESSKTLAGEADPKSTSSPEDHAMYYAFHEPLPPWLFGDGIDLGEARRTWNAAQSMFVTSVRAKIAPQFHQITDGPLVVGFATSDLIQGLYFGRTRMRESVGSSTSADWGK